MTPKERILTALRREQPDAVPTFEWFIDKQVAHALCGTADPIDVVEQLDLDAINIRPDYGKEKLTEDTYSTEWGMKRQITTEVIDPVIESPIPDLSAQADFTFPDAEAPHRYATLEKALERFGEARAIVWNLRDGFSDMRDLLGYENALIGMLTEPAAFDALLDRVVDWNLALARVAKERYGTQIVATTDDIAASNGLIFSPEAYFEHVAPRFERVIGGYKELGYLCIKHCDGNILQVRDHWIEAGVDCLDPVDPAAGMELAAFKAEVGDKVCLKGNVNCMGALCCGTAEEVEEEVRACLRAGGPGGGYILSSSNTIHSGVKPENYTAMLTALRACGVYPLP